jgi:hypothetical protein
VSDSGDVFWEWNEPEGPRHLYVRDTATEKTVQVDAPREGVAPEPASGAEFQYASPDGERVYFTDDQHLVPEASGPGLYVYNTVSGSLQDIVPGGITGVMIGASTETGEYVYFAAGESLYVAHVRGRTSTISLIAKLSGDDAHDWDAGPANTDLGAMTSRVSENGLFVSFMSARSLTGYDNVDAVSGLPDEEVFEYNAVTGRLTCASCNPTGARPHGVEDTEESGEGLYLLVDRPENWAGRWLAGSIPGWTRWHLEDANYQSRYLDDSGRLFFNAADALVPQDTNGKEDVYEYEPQGVGPEAVPCGPGAASGSEVFKAAHQYVGVEDSHGEEPAGCVALISSGKSSKESAFLDASENGDDVFFLTAAPLASSDIDTADDVYDAHVCSGELPCASTVVSLPPCTTADACKAALTPQPAIFGAPASSTFSGAGNVTPAVVVPKKAVKCVKPKRLVHGKCTKKAKKRSKRARKSNRGARS